jgi:hypothetical protein
LILSVEIGKIFLFWIIEFFIYDYAALELCDLIQSAIRALICSMFLRRCLHLYQMEVTAIRVFYVYLAALSAFYIIILSTMFLPDIGVSCSTDKDW